MLTVQNKFIDRTLNGHFSLTNNLTHARQTLALSCYTFVWNQGAPRQWTVDMYPVYVPSHTILSLSPGQTLLTHGQLQDCIIIQFNRQFYCIENHDQEVSCNGMLFNGSLSAPLLALDEKEKASFCTLLDEMKEEFAHQDETQGEMLKILLKRFIIKCMRLARAQLSDHLISTQQMDLVRLYSALVEKHFRSLHKVTDYAGMMNKSAKTLANVFRVLGEKTPLQIIHERIVLEAKKRLRYTDHSVKEIAYSLGFSDPTQFSRLFKNLAHTAPADFRRNIALVREE